jgi:ATP-dependent DNA helicase RecG
MPKDRKKIITEVVGPLERKMKYDFIREEIKKGRQCFVILPLVEDSKVLTEVKAAVSEHKKLSEEIFPDLKVGLVHGKLPAKGGSASGGKSKETVMKEFAEKKLDILVATAVVEVGIDIPNASVMIIEDADRFGLSQLHQFRGRIGRGEHQSYCFLFTSSDSGLAKKRLKALVNNSDGFAIAEKDLELRGPGQFFGTRQSGIPDIAMENLTNIKLIQIAREEAQNLLASDPELKKHLLLKDALQKFDEKVHLE